jgi:hypothetical protein
MSGSPPKPSHATTWTTAVLALPVIYLLSVPPISLLTATDRDHVGYRPRPWANEYSALYDWLLGTSLMREPLQSYHSWWFDLTSWTARGDLTPPPNGPAPTPPPPP